MQFNNLLHWNSYNFQRARQKSIRLHGQTSSQQSQCHHREEHQNINFKSSKKTTLYRRWMYILLANKRLYGTISNTSLWKYTLLKVVSGFYWTNWKTTKKHKTSSTFPPPASHTGSHLSFLKEIQIKIPL